MILILVTNAIDPYYKEVVNVMAQSRGSRYWFRYEQQHVSKPESEVWTQVNGSAGIIFFRNRITGHLYPIRAFTDANVESVNAPIIAIDFCVGGFPCDPQSFSTLSEQPPFKSLVESSRDEAARHAGVPLINTIDPDEKEQSIISKLFDEKPTTSIQEVTRWVKTIETIKDLDSIKKSCFLYLRDVQDQRGNSLRRSRKKRGFLSATAGTYYVAKVSQYCPKDSLLVDGSLEAADALKTPIQIETSADHDQIAILEGKHTLDGRYDECQLTFKTETGSGGSSTVVRISQSDVDTSAWTVSGFDTKQNSQESKFVPTFTASKQHPQESTFVPTISADIEIRHAPWQKAMLLTAVSLLLGGLLLNLWVPDAKDGADRNVWQNLKHFQIFTILLAIGATLTTWLGKDFWASLFRHEMWLWSSMVMVASNWLILLSLSCCCFGLWASHKAPIGSDAKSFWVVWTIGESIMLSASVVAKWLERKSIAQALKERSASSKRVVTIES